MTDKPKLFVTRPLPSSITDKLAADFQTTLRQEVTALKPQEISEIFAEFDCVLTTFGDVFDASDFRSDQRCKLLANYGVGYSHIDIQAAKAAGITVTITPGAVTDATADIGMMLMLMAGRRASEGEACVRAGEWTGWHPNQYLGQHISGKTLGIIGMGRIGQAIATRAHFGFRMKVVFFNQSQITNLDIPNVQQLSSISEVMAQSDFVQICVPGGADTLHLIGAEELAAMQPHGVIINTARGEVIDEQALIDALVNKRIFAAGLDVYENEPTIPEALRALPNVTLLPHMGTSVLEVRELMGTVVIESLQAFSAGKPIPNVVSS
ncbi:MAG: lactate dehydrogenase-like 2-hydroxyacid dehydrogenase [Gammaproteobacteria bacterium]|jgi:lactate dehydrogenase-like 2-hydroxyacid dehydrogenase